MTGPIDFVHQFVDMEDYTLSDGSKTCTAAMGYSFAAGTADGPSTLLPHVRLITYTGGWGLNKTKMQPKSMNATTASSSHMRTMLPESSSRSLPAKQPNHAT